jgi:ACDE family multidrug resistance protein
LIGVFLQGPALGRLVRRFGEPLLNRTGFAGCVFGFALLAFCYNVPMLLASILVVSIGGLVRPALTSLITHTAAREEQGVVLGLTQSLQSVAMIAAPPLGGYLIDRGVLTAWGLAASAVSFAGFLIASGRETPAPVEQPQRPATLRT